MVRLAALMIALAVMTPFSAAAASCQETLEPSVLDAANNPAVSGIIERVTVAANPLPWGRSVSATTRVWGAVTVDRWRTSSTKNDGCPAARYRESGTVEYDFAAPAGAWSGPVHGTVETLDVALSVILEQRFGPPVTLEVGTWDRVMATLRVFPSLLGVPVVLLLVLFSLRRRHRTRRDYLF